MANLIKICTLNCRGLNDKEKRRDVFNYIKDKAFSIYCLQDVHWNSTWEKFIRTQWGYDCYIAGYKTNSRGTAILFNNNFEFNLNRVERDDAGNWLAIDITIHSFRTTLISIYGPNKDDPDFYANVRDVVNNFDNPHCILCGDWNLVQDPINDTYNYGHTNNPKARQYVLNMMDELDLCDPWRVHFPGISRYTWRRQNPVKQARLDFFLISSEILNMIDFVDIQPGYRTDHSCVVLFLRLDNIKHGKGTWKFNNSLLTDDIYIATIRKSINDVKLLYAATPYNHENIRSIPNDSFHVLIDDQLFFEMILLEIRGETIKFSSRRKKESNEKEYNLKQSICEMEQKLSNISNEYDVIKANEMSSNLREKQLELENIRHKKLSGSFIRSKAKWIEEGEKPTKYFLNLEKRSFINKTIGVIESKDGQTLYNQESIKAEITDFYSQLYSRVEVQDKDTIINLESNKLTNDQAKSIEGSMTIEELSHSLNI